MPRGKTKRTPPNEDNLQKAVNLVLDGYSQRQAAAETGEKRTTIQRRLKLHQKQVSTYGGFQNCKVNQAFTDEQEQLLIRYLRTHLSNNWDKNQLRTLAYNFAKENKIAVDKSWIKKCKAGIVWCKGFIERHQQEDFISSFVQRNGEVDQKH